MSDLKTKEEVSDYLKISMDTLERLLKRGELESIKIGRSVRISQEAIEEFLVRARTKAEA